MPAFQEIKLTDDVPARIGLIAGGGSLPLRFLESCDAMGIDVFVVGFAGQTDPRALEGRPHVQTRIGAAGHIIQTLRTRDYQDLVFIGSVRRPSLAELRPDLRTATFFLKTGVRALGDDGLLQAMRAELEKEGFRLHGIQKFLKDAVTLPGPLGRHTPDRQDWEDIMQGGAIAHATGDLDLGQSVIVQDGLVLGVEAVEGTDELIRRCAGYRREGRKPILVKAAKPRQDRDMDLPTIGPETVQLCANSGMAGIAVEAGNSLIVDPIAVAAIADSYGLFVVGAEFQKAGS